MSIKPLSYHGFSLDFLVAGSNREKEGKRPGDITACLKIKLAIKKKVAKSKLLTLKEQH